MGINGKIICLLAVVTSDWRDFVAKFISRFTSVVSDWHFMYNSVV